MHIIAIILIGLIGGIAVGIQSPMVGIMSQRVGSMSSSFIIHLVGTLLSALILFTRGGENITAWRTLPWYMLGAGCLGIFLFLSLSYTVPRLGATSAIVLLITGQLIIGMIIDHFGLLGTPIRTVDLQRSLAAVFLLVGGYLMVR